MAQFSHPGSLAKPDSVPPTRLAEGLQTHVHREQLLLAPYAQFGRDSRGRRYPEVEHPYRGPYQRDRDRVLHSTAFRRLSGKMQVFKGALGDYHRTRLTHTQEVASIARTIGRALRLNEDLIEALALLHDIGHPPFGHAGEEVLDSCLSDEGGFSHNQFALTLVEELEVRYQSFPGLNLTHEVLESQRYRITKSQELPPLLEAQVVDIADSITYVAHDTDDALKLNYLSLDALSELALVRQVAAAVRERYGDLPEQLRSNAIIHELIDVQVTATLEEAAQRLLEGGFGTADEVRRSGLQLRAAGQLDPQKRELSDFLYRRVYRHPDLVIHRSRAQGQMERLFRFYCERPERLPERFRARVEARGIRRAVADYLAGMTDRYFESRYQQDLA